MHVDYATQYALGRAGEQAAVERYEAEGYQTLGVRVRMHAGELDAIFEDADGTIVFVEVKSRAGVDFGAAEAVTAKKLATMRRCAAQWLDRQDFGAYRSVRFDVVECLFTEDGVDMVRFEGVEDGAC